MYDDINFGYDDCCCKMVLFKQLNITNTEQKHNEYERLKQCLQPQANDNIFQKICNDIVQVFSVKFDNKTAINISTLFEKVLSNEGVSVNIC